jgi:hypothetical protein
MAKKRVITNKYERIASEIKQSEITKPEFIAKFNSYIQARIMCVMEQMNSKSKLEGFVSIYAV